MLFVLLFSKSLQGSVIVIVIIDCPLTLESCALSGTAKYIVIRPN